MKRLLLLFLLPLSAWAVTRTITISAPSSVTAGQGFLVPTSAATDAGGGEQIGFYHAEYSTDGGSSWTGLCYDVDVGASATRNAYITAGGAGSTVVVRVRIAFRGGGAGDVDYNGGAIDWGGTWTNWQTPPTQYASISVVAPPNQAPIINWIQKPTSVYINQWFAIQSRGNDADGNLTNVFVWREWVPHAFNGGGNGYESYSDPNMTYGSVPGSSINFQTQAQDAAGATSAVIFHTVSVLNRAPTVQTSASPTTINFGQTSTITSVATDADGNLAFHGMLVLNQAGNDWNRGAMCDHSTGWGNHPTSPDILSANYTSGSTSGGSSTRSIVHRPSWVGTLTYHSDTHDGIVWASSDPGNWATCTGYANVYVNKATPTGSFPSSGKTPAGANYTVATGDLTAIFTNPYSGAVAPPTGVINFTIAPGSPNGAIGSAVIAGTTLPSGLTYTIRANYPGDANYNATSADSTWTVSAAAQSGLTITSVSSITDGASYTASAAGGAGTGALVWSLGNGSTASGAAINASTGVVTYGSTGTVVFKVYRAGDSNYQASATTADFTLGINNKANQAPVTITPASATYGNAHTVTAAGGSGTGALVWSLGNGSTASGAAINSGSGTITAYGSGTVVVKVQRLGDAQYVPSAWTADFAVSVLPRPLTVTLTGSKTFDGTAASTGASASITGGTLATGDNIGYSFGATSSANAGSYTGLATATITNAGAPNIRTASYSISYAGTYVINADGGQSAPSIDSGATVAYGSAYAATAHGGAGTGALVWTLGPGSTAPGAAINASSGTVAFTGTGTVVFNVYRAGDGNHGQSAASPDFTLTVTPQTYSASLPFVANFETSGNYSLGSLLGQAGWYADAGVSVVNSTQPGGLQEVSLPAAQPAKLLAHDFSAAGISPVFVDFRTLPAAGATPASSVVFSTPAAQIALVGSGSSATLWIFDGSGSGWSDTGKSVAIQSNGLTADRLWLTTREDYATKKWDLYLNGAMIVADLNFAEGTAASLTDFSANGHATAATSFDDFYAGPENILFVDADYDGMSDSWETAHGLNPALNDRNSDLDGDGLANVQEYVLGTDPASADTDGDGLTDIQEGTHGTNPLNADTDGDGMPDGWEAAHLLNPLFNDASGDPDGDGYTNLQEFTAGLDPKNPLDALPLPNGVQVVVPVPTGGFLGINTSNWSISPLPAP